MRFPISQSSLHRDPSPRSLGRLVCTLGLMFLGLSSRAAAADFAKDIQPLLKTYCYDCHGEKRQKGEVDLSKFPNEAAFYRNPKLWEKVHEQIHLGEMPPKNKKQLSAEEKDRMETWIKRTLAGIDDTKIEKNPGYVVSHRLNRAEYNNTVRDLFGVTNRPADKFPSDGGGGGGFDNNADTLFIPPILMERYLAAASEVLDAAPSNRIFIARPGFFTGKRAAARKIIEHHALRAFRRPVARDETDRFLRLYDQELALGESHEAAVKLALKGILVSPNFLFRTVDNRNTSQPFKLGDWEIATRLSYFLWSTMPDDELFAVARSGKLSDPKVVAAQAKRMMADAKASALSENFTQQWLGLRTFKTSAQPDPRRFSEFTPALAEAMPQEPVQFFHSLLSDNGSLLQLIDADYTYANEDLAKIYGIPGVTGSEFRRVSLTDRNRGGVLGMAAILTKTSYPLRTSPVLRGKWVLEEILGTPPPPPPPIVTSLPHDDKKTDGMTLRQRLEKHRSKAECTSCHSKLDPLGFGLESFDAIGRWRTSIAGEPVDASGTLPGGRTFSGPVELKGILLERREQFMRNLTERMLSYALGRGLEFYDTPTVRKITEALAKDEFKAQTLVTEVVMSYPFQNRKAPSHAVAVN